MNLNSEKNALFGYTGFVGKFLLKSFKFDFLYNSKNTFCAKNKCFDNIFISCIPAVKWKANKFPEEDKNVIEHIKKIFKTIKSKRTILISTIDVYENINNESDENTDIKNSNHAYGKNRKHFEDFILKNFVNVYILRLPSLFGKGLKKNLMYDLLNNNEIEKIYVNSKFQWYNLEWLKEDILICINNNLKIMNLFTEPLHTKFITEMFDYNYSSNPTKEFSYNTKTSNFYFFPNGENGYIRNRDQVLNSIKKFIKFYHKKFSYDLGVSNISNNNFSWEQYNGVLKFYDINYVEAAPTKYNTWENLFKTNKIDSELEIYSFQSLTYTIQQGIFDKDNEKLFNHLKNVIDLAYANNVKILVFGCPKNRRINENNDKIIFLEFMRKLGDYIKGKKIYLCIENNSKHYNCNFLNTIQEVGDIINEINHSCIKMVVDVGNCIMENDNIENMKMYKENIKHIHISEPYMKPFINFNKNMYKRLMCLLKEINYDGKITLEFLNENITTLNESIKNFTEMFLNN